MAKALLYDYFRSSASYRVRIALNQGVDYEQQSSTSPRGAKMGLSRPQPAGLRADAGIDGIA
jgi:hypothetical protein